jgi:hypothetical protein
MPGSKPDISIDFSKPIEIEGETFYPLSDPAALSSCAGRPDGTPCEFGGHCSSGQCVYSVKRLKELGIAVPDR